MNLRNILAASAVASALMLTTAACSSPDKTPVEVTSPVAITPSAPTASAPSTPTASAASQATGEEAAILTTVNGFYDYVTTPENADKITAAGERFADRAQVSNEEVFQLAKDYPEIFQYFDVSTPENIKNAYGQMVTGAGLAQTIPGIKIVVPLEAVKQQGDTATVNSTMVTVSTPERKMDSAADPNSTDLIDVVKKDGKWLMAATTPLAEG